MKSDIAWALAYLRWAIVSDIRPGLSALQVADRHVVAGKFGSDDDT